MALNRKLVGGPLSPIVDAGRDHVSQRKEIVSSKQEFLEHLTKIVESECPECKSAFRPLALALAEQIECERAFSDVLSRGVEDINDISERFAVVVRASTTYANAKKDLQNAKQAFENARTKLAQDRAMGGRNAPKLEQVAARAKEDVKNKITTLKEAIEDFIVQKEKFAEFRIRRLRESLAHIGQGTSAIMRQEVEAWKQIETAVETAAGRFKESIDTGARADDGEDAPLQVAKKQVDYNTPVESPAPEATSTPNTETPVPAPEPAPEDTYGTATTEDPYRLPYEIPSQKQEDQPQQYEEPRREEYNPFDNPFENPF